MKNRLTFLKVFFTISRCRIHRLLLMIFVFMMVNSFAPGLAIASSSMVPFVINNKLSASGDVHVSGRVEDANGNPMPGVTVQIKGTTTGTTTDASGHFDLNSPDNSTLIISSIGCETQTIHLGTQNRELHVRLLPSNSVLDQLVVVGYGKTKRKDLTGAISSVNATKLRNENPISLQDLLRANVPGLSVGFSAGAEPSGSFEIRGQNSLNANTSPLIVLDGVIYYGSIEDINPNDIQSIDVLKDASAAAVYGAQAANGVIAITTKKGRKGKPTINFNSNISLATMEVNQPVYNGPGFVKWRINVFKSEHGFKEQPYEYNDPRTLPSDVSLSQWLGYDGSSGDPVTVWLTRLNFKPIEIKDYKLGRTVNWYNLVFQNGLQQNYNLSVSGGSNNFNYYWSGGYLDNEGIIVGDKYSTVQTRLKLEAKVTNFLTVGVNTQFADRNEGGVPLDWTTMLQNSPYGSMYNDDSTDYRYSPQDDPGAGAINPLLAAKYTQNANNAYTLNSIIYGEIKLPFGIADKITFTPNFDWNQALNHVSSGYAGSSAGSKGGTASRNESFSYQWQIDNTLTWNKTLDGIHHFDVTLLAHKEKDQYWENGMSNIGFQPNDDLGYHAIASGIEPQISSNDEYSTGEALMARVAYSLKDRYLVTLSMRGDGYSAFGQEHPWGTFPAAAVGWIFTKEPFFKANWLDFGKLRLSYGVNGNRDIGQYVALADLTAGQYMYVDSTGSLVPVSDLYVSNMANAGLKWERTASLDAGLDFSIAHNIINGSIDVYRSKTTNLLIKRSLPDVVGFSYVWSNLGEVDNKGLEVSLHSNNINHVNFSWQSSFNFSLNRNAIIHLYGYTVPVTDANGKVIGHKEPDDINNGWFIGHAISSIWDLKVQGVWQENQADQAAIYGVQPGDFKVQDVNKDGLYTNADRQFLGYTTPRYQWSLRNDFTFFRSFTCSLFIYSDWGQMGQFNQATNADLGQGNRRTSYVLPYWTPDNPENSFARIGSSKGSATYNIYRKKSFIRLGNVSVGYTLPSSSLQRIKIQSLKLYLSVKNAAFYAPDWNFWDPENSGPTPRTYTFGVNLTL